MQEGENESVSVVWRLYLGLGIGRKMPYIGLFNNANQMLILFNLNEQKCIFANFAHVEVEVWRLHELGLSHAANDPCICCLLFAHEVLNLFYLNEPKCIFANFQNMHMEV